ncbi:MAG: DUF4296 domain-containing protein [Bacteroidetes bacterium]|nr:DUF4296 domain-containing protein [Bacteroidota bacterium]
MRAYVLASVLLLAACTRKPAPPPDLLPPETFERVLAESLLIEARLNHEMVVDKRVDSPTARYYADMFKEQGVTEQAFKATYDHYVQRPEELKKIYEAVLNDLQHRADSVAH